MQGLASLERDCVEQAAAAPMLAQVEAWAAINSGSRNLDGLKQVAAELAAAFAALPGEIELVDADPVEAIDPRGRRVGVPHGQNIRLRVRPNAPLQLLFTGHMDTVFGADHVFQTTRMLEPGVLGGPGVADMKGGLAIMLAALTAFETVPLARRIGYEVVLNSDEEVGSLGSADLIASAAQGKRAALTYEPSALPDGTFAGARPGSGNFDFTVIGKSAHAGRNPNDGRNAILAAADLALRLKAGMRDGLSVNPPGSTAAVPTTSSPTARFCGSICARAASPTSSRPRN
jgi:glutamate carboxypeptidase